MNRTTASATHLRLLRVDEQVGSQLPDVALRYSWNQKNLAREGRRRGVAASRDERHRGLLWRTALQAGEGVGKLAERAA